jgi:DNA-directed RNA polymerase subunit RPC12/RpoP
MGATGAHGEHDETYEVSCPHCHKQFTSDLIGGDSERYRGFKCPHCKLFVPYERADADAADAEPAQRSR